MRRATKGFVALCLVAVAFATFGFVVVLQEAAHAGTACSVTNPVVSATGHATFTVQGSCTVSLVSYELHGNGALGDQTQFDATTKEFSCVGSLGSQSLGLRSASGSAPTASGAGGSCPGELTVTVPDCEFQLDLVLGPPRNPPTGYGPNVLAFRYGGSGQCVSTTTTTTSTTSSTVSPTTTSPTSTSTSFATSTTSGLPSSSTLATGSQGGPVQPQTGPLSATPTEMPRTGGGEALGLGALLGLGLIGAGRYVERRGKRRRKAL